MTNKFDNTIADSQATPVEPIMPNNFDLDSYAEYSMELDKRCKAFWEADSGLLVYRRMRVASCFAEGCKDMERSLENQLGALNASMKFKSDVPNFLESWYGIGTIASAYNDEYSWLPNSAPALELVYSSIEEILDKIPVPVSKTKIGSHTLNMIDYFVEQTKGKLPISLTDTQSPLNRVGQLITMNDFLINTIINPDAIFALFDILADLSIDFNKEQLKIIGNTLASPGHGFASSRAWKELGMSNDNILMMSPEQHHELTSNTLAKIANEFGGFAFHSCGDWEQWIGTVRKIKNLLMIDGAFSEQTDPGAITNLESFHQFAGDKVIVNARIVGGLETKVRDIIRSWKLGQITKIEQVWNDNDHRWHVPDDPDVAAIREEDTDWNRWLLGKPYVSFDPWKYFEFRIFRDYSGGITSQWMSHASGLIHFYTDTAIPDSMVANGGIFGWPDIRQNSDTFQTLATYDDAKFLHSYTSNYANKFGDYTCIRGKEGTLFAHGGEGSSRWFFIPEHQHLLGGFDFYEGMKEAVKSGKAEIVTTEEYGMKLGPVNLSDNMPYHFNNWVDCMRNRDVVPNGNIHTGFWHSIASIMATQAYREGKKLYLDRTKEEIVDHPVIV